ncbi:MAG: hypothetical protein LC808_18325, partial [Actinobacteria bacterium]|nr:hypothetical protein [Actinomycetota bacterium]
SALKRSTSPAAIGRTISEARHDDTMGACVALPTPFVQLRVSAQLTSQIRGLWSDPCGATSDHLVWQAGSGKALRPGVDPERNPRLQLQHTLIGMIVRLAAWARVPPAAAA